MKIFSSIGGYHNWKNGWSNFPFYQLCRLPQDNGNISIGWSVIEPVTDIHDFDVLLDACVNARACDAVFVTDMFLSSASPAFCALTTNCMLLHFFWANSLISLVLYTSADCKMCRLSSSICSSVNKLQLQLHSNCCEINGILYSLKV